MSKGNDINLVDAQARHDFYLEGHATILVVDDNESFLNYVKTALSVNGNQVTAEPSPYEALKLFVELRPDFVFLDVNMPELDGVDLLRLMNQLNSFHAQIILMSANAHFARELRRNPEFNHIQFVGKPVSPGELRSVVHGDQVQKRAA